MGRWLNKPDALIGGAVALLLFFLQWGVIERPDIARQARETRALAAKQDEATRSLGLLSSTTQSVQALARSYAVRKRRHLATRHDYRVLVHAHKLWQQGRLLVFKGHYQLADSRLQSAVEVADTYCPESDLNCVAAAIMSPRSLPPDLSTLLRQILGKKKR